VPRGKQPAVRQPVVTGDATARYERLSYSSGVWYDLMPTPANGTDSPTVSATITGVTQANPGVVTCSGGHTYTNDVHVFISGVSGMTQLNDKTYTVKNATATTFELHDTTTGVAAVDTTGYDAYTSGGTATRGALTWPFFNGTTWVTIGNPTKLQYAGAFTLCVWYRQDTAIPRQGNERMLSHDNVGTRPFLISQADDTGLVQAYVTTDAFNNVVASGNYATNTYHMVCLVNQGTGGDLLLYVDGTLQGTASGDGGGVPSWGTIDTEFGRHQISNQAGGFGNQTDYFTGDIDTGRFYGRALSADEILRDYNAGKPAHP
jgi:hypothetical protein